MIHHVIPKCNNLLGHQNKFPFHQTSPTTTFYDSRNFWIKSSPVPHFFGHWTHKFNQKYFTLWKKWCVIKEQKCDFVQLNLTNITFQSEILYIINKEHLDFKY